MLAMCLSYGSSSDSEAWNDDHFADGSWSYSDFCVMPAKEFSNWGIYQPTQEYVIDFNGANNHVDSESGRNGLFSASEYPGSSDGSSVLYAYSGTMNVPNLGVDTLQVDVGCNVRTTIRNVGVHTISLIVKDIAGAIITEMDSCTSQTLKLASGADYMLSLIHI